MVRTLNRPVRSVVNRSALATVVFAAAVSRGGAVSVASDAVCDAAQAKRLFADGMKHLAAGEWDQACPRFEQSLACHPRASTQTKVAGCREHEGKLAEALVEYQNALTLETDAKKTREVEAEIRTFIDAIDARVPRLTITVSPQVADLQVKLNGRPVSSAQLGSPLRVDPGEQRVAVSAPGYPEEQVTVALDERSSRDVAILLKATAPVRSPEPELLTGRELSLRPVAPVAPPAPPPTFAGRPTTLPAAPIEVTRAPRFGARQTAALVAGGVAVVSLGVAGYFGLRTRSLVSEAKAQCFPDGSCPQGGIDTLHRASQAQLTGFVLAGLGVTSAVAGVVLLVTGARETTGVALSAMMSPAGVSAQATW
jgi:hypothetical protein